MKVIFLDFDGVVVPAHSWRLRKDKAERGWKPCIDALNRITDATGAVIVVSSTWRLGEEVVALRELLRGWGATGDVVGKTPRLFVGENDFREKERGHEIQWWLDQHVDVESFVILDDDRDMVHLMERLVHTDYMDGLTMEHAERAIAMLTTASAAGVE